MSVAPKKTSFYLLLYKTAPKLSSAGQHFIILLPFLAALRPGLSQEVLRFTSLASGPHVVAVMSRGCGAELLSLPTCSTVHTLPRGPTLWGVCSYSGSWTSQGSQEHKSRRSQALEGLGLELAQDDLP